MLASTVKSQLTVYPGKSYPLGATWDGQGPDGGGVNLALFSEHAVAVELCLFDRPDATQESHRILLPEFSDHVWHGYFPQLKPGQLYGFRVHGPWEPLAGHRFNANKLLLDPYAKAVARTEQWHDALFGYQMPEPSRKATLADADLIMDTRDSAPYAPLSVVVADDFDWEGDRLLKTPWHKTIIYEAHVKGLSMLHPEVPEALRGTYAGLASAPIVNHLLDLGITAIELLPVHQHLDDHFLAEQGRTNYWGYNTLGYFAPERRYSSQTAQPEDPVREFKQMVKTLHAAGIEVILDVVYNHTCEGNQMGPTLMFKGIDNRSYYKFLENFPRYYRDYTGCGNTLNVSHPRALQLMMDSLRYWVETMHVDGFRFDLAPTLARDVHLVDKLGSFFDIIHQDPVLCQVKLIAEPWDLGEGGYQVGNFPMLWTEWNGKYRDAIRSYWKGDTGMLSEIATRVAGSSDLYAERDPHASINFITSHDGFTLQDLVSYNQKHNQANGEDNRDGDNHNHSWNCGAEGPTDDPLVHALRLSQKRNLMATLLLSLGVPMITAGDELGKTQQGNNNAYCQDNPLSWLHWDLTEEEREFHRFMQALIRFRRENPVFQRRKFFIGQPSGAAALRDIIWYNAQGLEMIEKDWENPEILWVGALLNGAAINETDEKGRPIQGDTFFTLFNASALPVAFHLPLHHAGPALCDVTVPTRWQRVLDTREHPLPAGQDALVCPSNSFYKLGARSLAVFRWLNPAAL